jgi:hypothetical protein
MAGRLLNDLLRHFQPLAPPGAGEWTDGQRVERFVSQRDEAALGSASGSAPDGVAALWMALAGGPFLVGLTSRRLLAFFAGSVVARRAPAARPRRQAAFSGFKVARSPPGRMSRKTHNH